MNWIKIEDGAEMPGDGEKVRLRIDVWEVLNNVDMTAYRKDGIWYDCKDIPLGFDEMPVAWQPLPTPQKD